SSGGFWSPGGAAVVSQGCQPLDSWSPGGAAVVSQGCKPLEEGSLVSCGALEGRQARPQHPLNPTGTARRIQGGASARRRRIPPERSTGDGALLGPRDTA